MMAGETGDRADCQPRSTLTARNPLQASREIRR